MRNERATIHGRNLFEVITTADLKVDGYTVDGGAVEAIRCSPLLT
jgi:hypothetical protein